MEDMGDALLAVVNKYKKYPLQAYTLIFEVLDWHTRQKEAFAEYGLGRNHLTGQELVKLIFAYSIETYGSLASTVWRELNLLRSEDIGEMVYHLVDEKLIGKQESDSIEDFEGVLTIDDFDRVRTTLVGSAPPLPRYILRDQEKEKLNIKYTLGE